MNYFTQLEALLEASSAPYSSFNVASIVIDNKGKAYKGVNVESAAYPTTICAERNAIHTAVAEGIKKGDIKEVHILARNPQKQLVKAFPCGACRQVIAEQSNNDAKIFIYGSANDVMEHTIDFLLPFAFLGDEL